jgi:cell fate regulator YaaT (PSP1 superfamily)
MACTNCSTGTDKDGKVSGCNSKGGCSTGGCNKMNTYDWLSTKDIRDVDGFDLVEISFQSGSRKGFFTNPMHTHALTGDMVVVESGNGYDVGKITLSGELVRLQMKKKKASNKSVEHKVIRIANPRDLDKLAEARSLEKGTMIKARVIARSLKLDMKIGDVEYQADRKKATFFYTADGRVDFRELIRTYAKEFKVKIEMRQIGARQESARIGGIGSCGRELCCSTWLTDFKSVSTTAARYQNLAINQTKLSGQCGRLKCCLNFELDSYMDALQHFPKGADKLHTEAGMASLMKTDVFKGVMYYVYNTREGRGKFYPLKIDKVKEIQALNKEGKKPTELMSYADIFDDGIDQAQKDADDYSGGDLTGVVELPAEKRRKKKRNNKTRNKGGNDRRGEDRRGDRKPGDKRDPRAKAKPGEKKDPRAKDPRAKKPGNKKGPKPSGPKNSNGGGNNKPKPQGNDQQKTEGNKSDKGGGNNRNRNNNNRKPRPPRDNKPKGNGENRGGDKGGDKGGDGK